MAEIIGPAPEALSNDEIIAKYKDSLTQITRSAYDPTNDFESQVLISHARYQWLLFRGFANLTLDFAGNGYGAQTPDWVPFNGGNLQEETGADVRLCPPVNFLAGDGFKFMAVMGQSSPRVKAIADDLRNPDDIASAHCADTNIRDLWLKNKIDSKWKIPAFHIYTTGPCFIRGFWNADKVKYGSTVEPQIDVTITPEGLPVPSISGEKEYPNGDAEVSFHSVLEVWIPWESKEIYGNPLRLRRMCNKYSLIAQFPETLSKYRDSTVPDEHLTGAAVAASEARTATANPSGTAQTKRPNEWCFTEWWIPPYLFESVTNDEARTCFKNQFARGMYIADVGDLTVKIDERTSCDEWTVAPVNREEKIMDRPVCADNVPLQRAINDLFGMAIETVLRAITQTIMDNQLIDREAMSTKEAVPAEIILTALPVDGDISKRIYQIPPSRLSDQVIPLIQLVRTFGQDISGVRPELSGGGAPTQTFREAKQRKDQALAQLAPQAQGMRDAAAELAKILVNLRSKFGSGTVKATRKTAYGLESDVADMADLQECGWHTEADDQFPLTLSDRRDTMYSLLKDGMAPEIIQALGVLDPINVNQTLELLGIPDFQSAVADQLEKTLKDIDELLLAGPIMQPGQPPQPSVPADPFDNAPLVLDLVGKWMVGPVGQKHKGTPGFANVLAYWTEYKKLASPPAPPPPPPIKGSLAMSAKLEDFPSLIGEVFQGAGLPAPPGPVTPLPHQPDAGTPSGPQQPPGASSGQVSPLAPLPPSAAPPAAPPPM